MRQDLDVHTKRRSGEFNGIKEFSIGGHNDPILLIILEFKRHGSVD
jgi:hypothetical protein